MATRLDVGISANSNAPALRRMNIGISKQEDLVAKIDWTTISCVKNDNPITNVNMIAKGYIIVSNRCIWRDKSFLILAREMNTS
jgi:hypothetical protein